MSRSCPHPRSTHIRLRRNLITCVSGASADFRQKENSTSTLAASISQKRVKDSGGTHCPATSQATSGPELRTAWFWSARRTRSRCPFLPRFPRQCPSRDNRGKTRLRQHFQHPTSRLHDPAGLGARTRSQTSGAQGLRKAELSLPRCV